MICPCLLQWRDANSWSSAIALFRDSFVKPSLTPSLRRGVPSNLIGSLRFERWHWHRLAVEIDGDESEITRVGVKPPSRQQVLRLPPHSDFHRRPADIVHARLHDEQVSDVNRLPEIDAID